jgi:hypothetical protein
MNNPNYSSNKLNYDWPLLIKTSDNRYRLANEKYVSDDKTSLHSIDTSGDFYVYTGGSGSFSTDFDDDGYLKDTTKMQVWGQYGYLRAWIEPHYCDENGSNEVHPKKNGSYYDQWSDQIVILVERGGLSFWSDWTSAITSGTNDSEHWLSNASGMSANATVDPTKGNYIALLKQSGGSNNATLAKVINPKYLRDARSYDKTIYGGKSYTSITNYSIVIDAQAGTSTAGIGVSLNGYNNTSGNKGIAGYQFYYDPGANGFPIRLLTRNGIIGSYNANGVAELQSPIRNDMTVTNGAGCDHTANQHDIFYNNYYNAQYNIASIQNSVLNDVPETAADNFVGTRGDFTQECKYMENRHRFIITILEYYDSDEENNRIIVRARLLKTLKQVLEEKEAAGKSTNETELRKTDPFLVGPDFYLSEPMWYGPFVGQKPVVSKNNKTYTFKTMRIGNTNAIVEREQAKDTNNKNIYDSSASYYVLQTDVSNGVIRRYSKDYDTRYSENGNSGKYKYIKLEGGIYKCLAMNPRQDLNRDNQLGELGAGRLRWIGLALWGGAISGKSQADIYEMEILPGFNGDELKAIMPSGAKMYNMSETWTSQDISKVDCKYDVNTDAPGMWNSTLFSSGYSDGAGNNSGYSSRFQDSAGVSQICIMSLQHYGHDAESGTKCPICGSYDAYASYYNALSDADKKKIHWGLPTS